MSRPDKAVEPSMEEILASIRKIISEEPIGSRPGPSDGQAPKDSLGRYEPGADPASGMVVRMHWPVTMVRVAPPKTSDTNWR